MQSHASALELQEFDTLVGLGEAVEVAVEEDTRQLHTNPMVNGNWNRTAGVEESAAGVAEFEHANPVLDEMRASDKKDRIVSHANPLLGLSNDLTPRSAVRALKQQLRPSQKPDQAVL